MDHCGDDDNRCEWAPNRHELRARLGYSFIGKETGWSYMEVLSALQTILSSSDLSDGSCDDGDMPRLGLFDRRKHPTRDYGAWKLFAGCALDSVDELSFSERVAYLKDLALNSAHQNPLQSCHRLTFQLCAKGCDCTDCGRAYCNEWMDATPPIEHGARRLHDEPAADEHLILPSFQNLSQVRDVVAFVHHYVHDHADSSVVVSFPPLLDFLVNGYSDESEMFASGDSGDIMRMLDAHSRHRTASA